MNKIKIQNGEHTIINLDNIVTIDKLDPSKTYLLNYNNDYDYYYLTETKPLELPEKVYGDKSHLAKYLKKYELQNRNLGVLLSGIKGDGKSVDAKMLALMSKQPIIIVNTGFRDQSFLEFVTNPVFNNVTFFIDEFEKIYHSDNIEVNTVNILKLLDGYSNNKNLFILTSNELYVSKYLINRPSRIRYLKKYSGLSFDLITEIVNDKIVDKTKLEKTLEVLSEFPLITMDVLLEIINDINDLNISCEEAIKDLNFDSQKIKINFIADVEMNGVVVLKKCINIEDSIFNIIKQYRTRYPHTWVYVQDEKIRQQLKLSDSDDEFRLLTPQEDSFIEELIQNFSSKHPQVISKTININDVEFKFKFYSTDVEASTYLKAF